MDTGNRYNTGYNILSFIDKQQNNNGRQKIKANLIYIVIFVIFIIYILLFTFYPGFCCCLVTPFIVYVFSDGMALRGDGRWFGCCCALVGGGW